MKKLLAFAVIALLTLALAGCAVYGDQTPAAPVPAADTAATQAAPAAPDAQSAAAGTDAASPTPAEQAPVSGDIGLEAAKRIAFEHAGLTEEQITMVAYMHGNLDRDDGRTVYEIDFVYNNTEYEYDIDPATGDIISFDNDIADFDVSSFTTGGSVSESDAIGTDAARDIALKHAGFTEAEVTMLRVRLDNDDGRREYDVEFYVGNTEYDYEINALTGDVLTFSSELDDDRASAPSTPSAPSAPADTSAYIGESAAGNIALARVPGATAANLRIHLDHDDGHAVYEGEIIYNGVEYEFEIDALTGNILDWDVDND